jgi:hypothetical protein
MSAWTPDFFAFFKFAVASLRLVFAVFTAAYFSLTTNRAAALAADISSAERSALSASRAA